MKTQQLLFTVFLLALVSCNNITPQTVVVTAEVTRIVQITITPIPTLTPTPTPNEFEISSTHVANAIGTPIKATFCYKATDRQGDLNNCSNQRRIELELQMSDLINKLGEKFGQIPEEQAAFLQLQAEWEDFVIRECEFRSGHIVIETGGVFHYLGGSMALTNHNECLVGKYEDRLRELQIQLYEFSI